MLEEVGYDVKVEDMRPVTVYVSSTGISGSKHHMFYAAVSESMRSNGGGGGAVSLPNSFHCIVPGACQCSGAAVPEVCYRGAVCKLDMCPRRLPV